MPFALVDHCQELLDETIRPFEWEAGLAESGQILSLDLIQLLGITHKQPNRGTRRKFLDAIKLDRRFHLSLLEGFQIAINAALCSGVALCSELPPERQAIALPVLPAFENKR